MKRIVCILLSMIIVIVTFTFSIETVSGYSNKELKKIVDNAGLLSDEKNSDIEYYLKTVSEKHQFDVIVATVNGLDGKYIRDYADDFYDYNGYGYGSDHDGLVLLVDMNSRQTWLSTCGYGIIAFTDDGIQYILSQIKHSLSDGEYYNAFFEFATFCDRFLTQSKNESPYNNENLPKENDLYGEFSCALLRDGSLMIQEYYGNATDLVIPYELKKTKVSFVNYYAFSNNPKLKSITLPSSIDSLMMGALSAPNLEAIYVDENSEYFSSVDGVLFSKNKASLIKYPKGKKGFYQVPKYVNYIRPDAFSNCYNLEGIQILGELAYIEYGAFTNCVNLKSVVLSESITTIRGDAFWGCKNLSSIVIPRNVISIDSGAFYGCSDLDVFYNGSEFEWNEISIAQSNQELLNASIHYNYNGYNFDLFKAQKIDEKYWSSAYSLSDNSNASRYRTVVEGLQSKENMISTEFLTKSYLNLSNLGDLGTLLKQNNGEYYYKLVLADLFVKQSSSADFNETLINQTLDFANRLDVCISDYLKEYLEKGLKTDLKNNSTLRTKIKNTLNNYSTFEIEVSVIETLLGSAEVLGDFFDELSTYLAVKNLSAETIKVLNTASELTANSALKTALKDFASAYSDNLDKICKQAVNKTTAEAVIFGLQTVIDELFSHAPGGNISSVIYSGGKCLSNGLTGGDSTSTIFLQMSATYEIENAIRVASDNAYQAFQNIQTVSNAKLLNTSFDIMINIANYGNELLIDYIEVLDNAWIIKLNEALGWSDGFEDNIQKFKEFGENNILSLRKNADLIYNLYINEYPELWDAQIKNYLNTGNFSIITFCDVLHGVSAVTNDQSVNPGVKLNVNIVGAAQKEQVEKSLNKDIITAYDITLTLDNTKVQVNDGGYIIVRMPLPEGKVYKNVQVVRIDDDGTQTYYAAQVVDGMIEFKTDHFSVYAAVEIEDDTIEKEKTTIKLTKKRATLYVKGKTKINAKVENGVGKISYVNLNKKIVKVDSKGNITALKKGKATIIVTNNGVSKKITVKVKNPTLNRNKLTLKPKKKFSLKITGKVGKATFKTNNKKIAKVNSKGKVVAKKKGRATITVKANGVTLKCKVTVK